MNAEINNLVDEIEALTARQGQLLDRLDNLMQRFFEWLPTEAAAAKLNRDPQALTRWTREGRVQYGIHYRKRGKGYEWNVWQLNLWLNKEQGDETVDLR